MTPLSDCVVTDLWVMAAKFEFETAYSIEAARHVLLKGLSFHKESKLLWHEVVLYRSDRHLSAHCYMYSHPSDICIVVFPSRTPIC